MFSGTATATYRLDGLLGTRGFPNGETVTLAYDPARRPTSASLSSTGSFSQAYDRVGNVTSEARSLSGVTGDPGTGTNSFSYDPLRRLIAETGLSSGRTYQYDLDSNRTRKVEGATTIDYTFDRTDQLINQTIAGTGTAFSYDQYGNLTQSGNSVSAVTAYTYGTASQLTSINPPGTTTDVALSLDALGRYATRVVNGVTDTYGYLGTGETVTTIVGATTRLAALDSGGSRLAAKDGTTSAYLLSDLHGNVAATERSGSTAIANAIRYDGYGQTLASYAGTGAVAMDAKYQGRLDLSATADPLYDMSARMYMPGIGHLHQPRHARRLGPGPAHHEPLPVCRRQPDDPDRPDGTSGVRGLLRGEDTAAVGDRALGGGGGRAPSAVGSDAEHVEFRRQRDHQHRTGRTRRTAGAEWHRGPRPGRREPVADDHRRRGRHDRGVHRRSSEWSRRPGRLRRPVGLGRHDDRHGLGGRGGGQRRASGECREGGGSCRAGCG